MLNSSEDLTLDYVEEIAKLKKSLNAVILAHYYQESEIQDIADFLGDSLQLAQAAQTTTAEVIVFAGVHFMAETAKVLNPEKQVLLPDLEAGCSLADDCPADRFSKFLTEYPDHVVVTYVNCSAEVKALSDILCTSSNAEKVIQSIPEEKKIVFAPDQHLGRYLMKKTGRDMVLWEGSCVVHETFSERELVKLKTRHPEAKVIAHPECPEAILQHASHIGSTSSLLKFASSDSAKQFIVVTEPGIIHQMQLNSPNKEFIAAPPENGCGCNNCPFMKLNTLEKLYKCMKDRTPEVTLSPDLIEKAKIPLERMLELS